VGRRAVGRRVAGLAVALGAAVTACSSSAPPTIDQHEIVTTLLTTLHRQRPSITIQAACPSGIPPKVGATFTCSVSLDGVAVSYAVQISGVSSSGITIASRPTEPIIDTREAAAAVTAKLAPELAGATVTCGAARFVQLPVHGTFTCTVSAGGQSDTLRGTVQDDQGNVAFAAATPAASSPASP
jgi:hypothetical protein